MRHHQPTTFRRGRRALALVPLFLAACDSAPEAVVSPVTDERSAVEWLRTNAASVRSVQFDDTNYADLQPLRAAIGNARVVMLGESTHGDGTAFRAKARLVRFLHEEMGFDVLAFEGGLYDMEQAWQQVRRGTPALAAVRESLFEIWTYSQEVQPLFEYVGQRATSARPLELAGFDSQFTGPLVSGGTGATFAATLEAYLASRGSPFINTPEWPAFRAVVDRIARQVYRRTRPDAAERESFAFGMPWLTVELSRLQAASPSLESARWKQIGDALDAQGRAWFVYWEPVRGTDYSTIRDSSMARNLHWLATSAYPGRKIVVWAANAHIGNGVQRVLNPSGTAPLYPATSFIPMGEIARRLLPGQVYSVGFVAGGGRTGPARVREGELSPPTTLAPPMVGSWEWLFLRTERPYLFLDLVGNAPNGSWVRGPRIARPLGNVHALADWSTVFDGLFFVAQMEAATAGL